MGQKICPTRLSFSWREGTRQAYPSCVKGRGAGRAWPTAWAYSKPLLQSLPLKSHYKSSPMVEWQVRGQGRHAPPMEMKMEGLLLTNKLKFHIEEPLCALSSGDPRQALRVVLEQPLSKEEACLAPPLREGMVGRTQHYFLQRNLVTKSSLYLLLSRAFCSPREVRGVVEFRLSSLKFGINCSPTFRNSKVCCNLKNASINIIPYMLFEFSKNKLSTL